MSNVSSFPSRNRRRMAVAGEWIAAIERGITEEEERELGDWLASDQANYDAFMELAELWDNMDALGHLSDLFPEPRSTRRLLSAHTSLAVAASVVIAVALVAVFGVLETTDPNTDDASVNAASNVYETTIGEQASHELPDGSTILLNTNSRIRVDFTAANRLLILDRGEIHVTVAHDRDRRLSVMVGDKIVQAVGTEFNVEITADKSIELIVTEGVVLVGVTNRPIDELPADTTLLLTQRSMLVGAGEEAVIESDDSASDTVDAERIESDEIAVKLSWREGNLIFRGESLEEAVTEAGRYIAVKFVFLDEEAKKTPVAGLYKAGDVEGLLAALRNHFDITYEWQGDDKILLSKQ